MSMKEVRFSGNGVGKGRIIAAVVIVLVILGIVFFGFKRSSAPSATACACS